MKKRKVMKLASRGKRLGAYCIDAVIPASSFLISGIAFTVLMVTLRGSMNGFGYDPYSEFGFGYGYGYGFGYNNRGLGGIVAAFLIAMLLMIAYLVVQIVFFTKSKTIGKAALGLQVISSEDGEPIGFWKMLFREWFVKQASASVFLLGFIWVLLDDKNRGWHDKILDTYVVDLKESEALNRRPQRRPQTRPSAQRPVQKMTNAGPAGPSGQSAKTEHRHAPAAPSFEKVRKNDVEQNAAATEIREVLSEAPSVVTGSSDDIELQVEVIQPEQTAPEVSLNEGAAAGEITAEETSSEILSDEIGADISQLEDINSEEADPDENVRESEPESAL